MAGLKESSVLPQELIIVHMNEAPAESLPEMPYPIHSFFIQSEHTAIPLAQARNHAACQAQSELLVFLDVDCIPETDLVETYRQAVQQWDGLLMGSLQYLPPGFPIGQWTHNTLRQQGITHPAQPITARLYEPSPHYERFWTLNCAIRRQLYWQLSGMDEQYYGYGAEDTDFAFTARAQQVPFALCRAVAYHQPHPVYRPPLQHFTDIVRNARRFYQKWNLWPMDGWLASFAHQGLIQWTQEGTALTVLREPTSEEIQSVRSTTEAF